LLTSLRLTYIPKHIDIEIREQIDFARILYSKGLYMESLRILERIKQSANEHHQDILHLEIIDFQKLIEARHVTRSRQVDQKMDRLLQESAHRSRVIQAASELTNQNIQIHGYYIEYGHVYQESQRTHLQAAWRQMQPEIEHRHFADTFFEKVNRYQAYMWYRYILLELEAAREHAYEWVNCFFLHPQMQEKDPDLFLRGLYYLLVFLYLTNDAATYRKYLAEMQHFVDEHEAQFNTNSRHIAFVYTSLSQLNYRLLVKDYTEGLQLAEQILAELPQFEQRTDDNRLMLLHYKIASLYFTTGRYDEALDHLNHILNFRENILREDLDINTRLLQLLCFFETEAYFLMEYRLKSLSRSMGKAKEVTESQRMTLRLLKDLLKAAPLDRPAVLTNYQAKFAALTQNPVERKNLHYLDIPTWLAAALEKRTMAEQAVVR
jgi:tetratricopeptide (TPR) repeat protein